MLRMTAKEREKVTHDINNRWHAMYQGEEICLIHTRSNKPDSPFYSYYFINRGYDDYVFIGKLLTPDRR